MSDWKPVKKHRLEVTPSDLISLALACTPLVKG